MITGSLFSAPRAIDQREEIAWAVRAVQHAEENLAGALDDELVDAAIYELNSARMRLNYLLRQARATTAMTI